MHYRGGNHEMHTYSGEFKENTYFNLLDRNVGKKVSLFDFYCRIWVRLNYCFVVAVFLINTKILFEGN